MAEVDTEGIRLMSGGEPVVELDVDSEDLDHDDSHEHDQVRKATEEASAESEADQDQDSLTAGAGDKDLSATADDPRADPEDQMKVNENIQATSSAFNQVETQAKSCASLIQSWIDKVKSGEVSTEKGLTFLEMKNHSLLNYIISLTGLVLEKCSGKSIQGSSYLDQLIESRIILEKIRPIDQKLKYQIDKLVRIAVEGKVEMNDPLMYKANLDNFTSGAQEFDEGSDEDVDALDEDANTTKSAVKGDGVYRPPKVAPQHYDEEVPKGKAGGGDGRKRPAINRTLIRELQEEYLETPVEVHNMGDAYAKRMSREVRDKQRFEESFMTRLPVTKKDKHKERSVSTMGVLGDELTDFSGKRARLDTTSKSKKRKSASKKGKGRGSKKRFRK